MKGLLLRRMGSDFVSRGGSLFLRGMYRYSLIPAGSDKVMNETRMDYNRSPPLVFFVNTRTLSLSILLVSFFHL